MSLEKYQRDVIGLLFAKDFEKHLDALAKRDAERARKVWRVHRRMARSRLSDVVEGSFPRLHRLLGERFDDAIAAWLDESPPRSPYLRAVAGEIAGWIASIDPTRFGLPAWAAELARYEWLLLDVEYAAEEEGAAAVREVGELSFERPAVLTPAHVILRVGHAVHRLPVGFSEKERALVVPGDFALCLYRDPATHETRVLELSPVAAAILEEVAPGDRSVVDAVRAASQRVGFAIDGELVASFSDLVADLVERGIWLGSRA